MSASRSLRGCTRPSPTFVDCLADAGCLAGGPGERDWMRPSVVGVSADPADPADLGNDSLLNAVVGRVRNDALRSDMFDGFNRRLLPRGFPYMTTDTSTLPRRALVERDDSATPTRRESPLGTDHRGPAARPPRTKRGGGDLLGPLLPDQSRQPASDHLLLLGPNGGPLWFARTEW